MPVTKLEVKNALMPDEPDYSKAAHIGSEALPHLKEFIAGPDEALASKAAYLVGLIKDAKAVDLLVHTATSQNDLVRIAVAATAKHLNPIDASKVLSALTRDVSYGVRKMVLKSAPIKPSVEFVAKIKWMARNDPERLLRHRASEILSHIQSSVSSGWWKDTLECSNWKCMAIDNPLKVPSGWWKDTLECSNWKCYAID